MLTLRLSSCSDGDNGNYIWIQAFYSALNSNGKAGFVMANSAADTSGSELAIRRKLIEPPRVPRCVADPGSPRPIAGDRARHGLDR